MDKPKRRYEVTLDDGRVVSRQYAHQLKHIEEYKERQRKYYQANKEKVQARNRRWSEAHKSEDGLTYYQKYYRDHKAELSEKRRLAYIAKKEAAVHENPQQ